MQRAFLNVWRLTMFILCLTRSASPSLKKWSLDSPLYKGIVFFLSLLLFIIIILFFFLSYINYVHYLFETKNCRRLINKCGTMLKAFVFSRSRLIELKLDGLADCKEQWTSIDDIGKVFRHKQTALSGIECFTLSWWLMLMAHVFLI